MKKFISGWNQQLSHSGHDLDIESKTLLCKKILDVINFSYKENGMINNCDNNNRYNIYWKWKTVSFTDLVSNSFFRRLIFFRLDSKATEFFLNGVNSAVSSSSQVFAKINNCAAKNWLGGGNKQKTNMVWLRAHESAREVSKNTRIKEESFCFVKKCYKFFFCVCHKWFRVCATSSTRRLALNRFGSGSGTGFTGIGFTYSQGRTVFVPAHIFTSLATLQGYRFFSLAWNAILHFLQYTKTVHRRRRLTSHESQVEPPEVVDDDEADEQEDGGRQDSVAVAAKLDFSLLLRDKAKAMMRFLCHKNPEL